MKTIENALKEIEKTNLTFSQINPQTTDFLGFEFLEKPHLTLIKKVSENIFIVSYQCDDKSTTQSLRNGVYKVITEDNYVYHCEAMKMNNIIEL